MESFKKYVERCLNRGTLSLNHLNLIEEKLLEDFGFDVFHAMGYGRFLEFILHEAKQVNFHLKENTMLVKNVLDMKDLDTSYILM